MANKNYKIYGFSGLGADERVFEHLNLTAPLVPIKWIEPEKKEPLQKYTQRLLGQIDQSEPMILLGVSFGGLVAVEMAKILNPIKTILISTAEVKNDLRRFYRLMGKTGLVNVIPSTLFIPHRQLTDRFVGAENKELLRAILNDTDPKFVKWAVRQLIRWENETMIANTLKINGNNDLLMPHRDNRNQVIVDGGRHFIVVDQADKVSSIINEALKSI